jgi:hypothetical protein
MSIPNDKEFTKLIFDQYKADNGVPLKVMKVQRNYEIPVKTVYPGTEANEGIVYGYNCKQQLLRNGGIKNSYNKEFKTFGLNYNGVDESEMVILNPERLHDNYKAIVSYFYQRGYPLQQDDQPKAYNNIYLSFAPSFAPFVYVNGIQLVHSEKRDKCGRKVDKIVAVDFWLNYGYGYFDPTIELYTQTSNYKSNGLYPIRIPLTTNNGKFEKYQNVKPIAYYDEINSLLRIKVPETDTEGILNSYTADVFGQINFNIKQYILAFDATYKILRRNSSNELVSAGLDSFTCLAQTNPILNMKFRVLNVGNALPPIVPGENVVPLQIPFYYGPGLHVNTPTKIAGDYEVGTASFGATIYTLTGDLAFTTNLDGTPNNPGDFVGKIAMVRRGNFNFTVKAANAQAAGAIGCIIINNAAGPAPNLGGADPTVVIPVVSVSLDDGNLLVANLPVNVTLDSGAKRYYAGNLLVHNGGDNPKFNLNAFPAALNANVYPLSPLNSGIAPTATCRFGSGDNPATKLIEGWAALNASNAYDNPDWEKITLQNPIDMMNGRYYPEQAPVAPIPVTPEKNIITLSTQAHEATHQTNFISGGIYLVPTEAMATAIELDTSATFGAFDSFRPSSWYPMIGAMTRGQFLPMLADSTIDLPANTYGASYFWRYLYEQFDPNQQLIRRCNDIAGQYKTFDLYNQNIIRGFRSNTIPSNNILQQALLELYDKDLKEVWNNFGIAQVLFRNNTSIPSQYRIQYPFWMYNTKYSGYSEILRVNTVSGRPQYANFWELLQQNAPLAANQISAPLFAAPGDTIIQTLSDLEEIFTVDLSNYSFYVPHDTTNIRIRIDFGEWKFSLLQFTSDGTNAGSFIIDGPYSINVPLGSDPAYVSYNVANHVPKFTATGNIYLVCSCVTITNQPGLYVYLGDYTLGGVIEIRKNLLSLNVEENSEREKAAFVMPQLDALPKNATVSPFLLKQNHSVKNDDKCPTE